MLRVAALIALLVAASSAEEVAPSAAGSPGEGEKVLSLKECIESALKYNEELIQARQKVEEVGGRMLMAKSRFLLHLDLLGGYSLTQREPEAFEEEEYKGTVRVSQRLFEFGKDMPQDVQLREARRQAVFSYENKVREVLSAVRRSFFSVLLREEQIKIRRDLLENFQKKLERAQAKRERKIVIPLDVLRAELDVLNEELKINGLLKDQFKRKMELLQLIGRPMGVTITLAGTLEDIQVVEEKAVRIALENSIQVDLAQEHMEEQKRAVRKVIWDLMPDLRLQAGVTSGKNTVGMDVTNADNTWGVDVSAEHIFTYSDSLADIVGNEDQVDRFAQVQLSLPLFDGLETKGRLKMEQATLRQLQAELKRKEDLVELDVRRAYQSLLEAREARRIQERRVEISKRRLEIQERLKEAGRIGELEIETFRTQFFRDQDQFFADQDNTIRAQEDLRKIMGWFEE